MSVNKFTDGIVGLVSNEFGLNKTANLKKKAEMTVTVTIDEYEAKRIAEELKEGTPQEAAQKFAQDLINRYFSVEYLDVEKLREFPEHSQEESEEIEHVEENK